MTLWNKIHVFVFLFSSCISLHGQNYYDVDHLKQYANYLFTSHQYSLSAQEYERLVFLNKWNDDFKLGLFRSYRLANDTIAALARFKGLFGDSLPYISKSLAEEYLKLKIVTQRYSDAQSFINTNPNLSIDEKAFYQAGIYLMQDKWQLADTLYHRYPGSMGGLSSILQKSFKIKKRSPFLAGTISAIIPGTGKIYCGYWKDGLFALLFIAANGWQAYRGFSRLGSNHFYGWFFGTISGGFYLGNIYGSIKAARVFNRHQHESIHKQTRSYMFSRF